MSPHATDIERGDRFAFGANWLRFLSVVDEERIRRAEQSLREMLGVQSLEGKSFLDIGQGSGLFSLAARRLGATVRSFDYDPESVACARELKVRYRPDDPGWHIEQGSVLDTDYLRSLGSWDVVYSWGVLHHTGSMWQALENVAPLVRPGGRLFIAIYNDQGGWSRRWRFLKRTYNKLPNGLKPIFASLVLGPREIRFLALATLSGKPWAYFGNVLHYAEHSTRGMSYWHDLVDWVGGYPFEVAKPEEVFDFYKGRGFALRELKTSGGGIACNEFVFERVEDGGAPDRDPSSGSNRAAPLDPADSRPPK